MIKFFNPGPGVLQQNPQMMMGQQPVLAGATGNARGSNRTPMYPSQQVGLGEAMMRIGGNVVGASQDGGLAAFQAGTQSYGDIMDYNRQRELEQYQYEQEQKLAEQRRQDLLRKMNSTGAGGGSGDPEAVGEVRSAIAKLQSARDMFTQDPDSSLTGFNWAAIASRLTGRAVGNEDEAKRLFLQEVRLDSVMQRVAQTKGAISNAEMQLFASQAPTLDSNDVVWKAWLDRQLLLQKKILNRLQNGIQVDPDAPLDADLADPNTSTVDQSVIDEANAVINGDGT
jgi:hypothetical protein